MSRIRSSRLWSALRQCDVGSAGRRRRRRTARGGGGGLPCPVCARWPDRASSRSARQSSTMARRLVASPSASNGREPEMRGRCGSSMIERPVGQHLACRAQQQPGCAAGNRGAVDGAQEMADQAGGDAFVKQHRKGTGGRAAGALPLDRALARQRADTFGGGQVGLKGARLRRPSRAPSPRLRR